MLGKVRGWVQICRGATLLFLFCHLGYVGGQIRYPVPEESQEGTFVGNVAQDFLLDTESLAARRLQVAGEVNQRHLAPWRPSGHSMFPDPLNKPPLLSWLPGAVSCGSSLRSEEAHV